VLSRRKVHCMRPGLYWQCRTCCKTESGVIFDPVSMRHSTIPIFSPKTPAGPTKIWWKWMESYSRRDFSFSSDKVPAIAGIMRHFQNSTGDTPVLGLWRRTLPQDLLWMRVGDLTVQENGRNFLTNIPSWSCLSCPVEISYDFWRSREDEDEKHLDIHDHITVLECDVTWTSEPLTSDIKYTKLVLNGPILDISLSIAPEAQDFKPPYFNIGSEKLDSEKHPSPWRCAGQFDTAVQAQLAPYLCLLVRSRMYKSTQWTNETFLILEPSGSSPPTYRRVGLGNFRGESLTFDPTIRRTLSLV